MTRALLVKMLIGSPEDKSPVSISRRCRRYFVQFLLWTILALETVLPSGVGGYAFASPPQAAAAARAGTAEAVRVDHAPRLDGTLADTLWQSAKPVSDFRQREP